MHSHERYHHAFFRGNGKLNCCFAGAGTAEAVDTLRMPPYRSTFDSAARI
jgi:hypothetical protein